MSEVRTTMAFKNALKIMINRFGLVWMLLLYISVLAVVLVSLSMAFMVPIYRALLGGGIMEKIADLMTGILSGESINEWFLRVREIMNAVSDLFAENAVLRLSSALWLVLVVVFAYRFLLGLYELPILAVIDGAMSSNATISFGGQLIAKLTLSCRFTLVKMLYTVAFDAIITAIMLLMSGLLDISVVSVFAPFLIVLAYILLISLRYTFMAMWAPRIAEGGEGIFSAFSFSVRGAIKNFGSVFAYFTVAWVLIIAVNAFIGIFTLGAGLLLSVPMSMLFVCVLNMTLYYGKNGKRYYVDNGGIVYTPPYKTSDE